MENINGSKVEEKNLEERTDNNEEVEVNTETEEKETLEENKVEEEAGEENKEPSTEELLEKIAEIEKKLAAEEEEKEALNNRLVRLQADFSNYRKRNEKEAERIQAAIVAAIMEDLLPVLDNFDRALAQEGSGEDFRKGIEMIHRQLLDFLAKQGVENIEAVGKEFDHNYHNAVLQVESEEHESGIVVEELQKGYILNKELVIRPSMVKVAK
ncbi:MAG TPA: nucleotide exchange factor GrpE [Halanaerobiaceae bacterium]|jgi:molecular chaperone GrpE|nr:nucleotide exchange factor GrpE [Bacillota bacterium]HHU92006.1 nucleotide exchange factor GrpE [Halanaerobiaceae bacterium]HOA40816.1 nucleotide exchange factor GrpE [Halanaerobiales bacterium]HPZ62925.1 nucleotide exchange factor GrpE [Halanaerobiales bacterium]HQD04170.1 nucleotide exchange factor GrpE [Halanaerobiales bacterium]